MREFLAMGGYAPYVWSAYGITLAALVLNVWWIHRLHRHRLERARTSTVAAETARKPSVRQL